MKKYDLYLLSPEKNELIENIVSFTAHDESGNFNILAYASRRMTMLSFGLASFQLLDGKIEYLAIPEALLYFFDNKLTIATTHYYRDINREKVISIIEDIFKKEEAKVKEVKRSFHKLDDEILKKMTRLQSEGRRWATS